MVVPRGRPRSGVPPLVIAVCWKWVATGGDERWAGVSEADRAALEVGLTLAAASGDTVRVVSAGGSGAERGLREALAIGAASAGHIDISPDASSVAVARALASAVTGASWVVCGDVSADRGSGSVPAFIAAELGVAQALGLLDVTLDAASLGCVRATRRLDLGRREVLDVASPAVLSVEGGAAHLRRASLPGELAARTAPIEVIAGSAAGPGAGSGGGSDHSEHADAVHPYRPRARAMPAPAGAALSRVLQLTDAGGATSAHEVVTLDPAAAATRILTTLTDWGYLP